MSDRHQQRVEHLLRRLSEVEEHAATVARELERSSRLITLGTISASIAHEINNLLTPALAYVQLAEAHPEDEDLQAKARGKICVSLEAAARITTAILGFSTEHDEPPIAHVGTTLHASLECLARDPAKDGIRLSTSIPASHHARMQPVALQQILMNLILNACNAMRGRGGHLRIRSEDLGDGTGRITVSDDGPGIPEEIIGSVFQPFVSHPPTPGVPGIPGTPGTPGSPGSTAPRSAAPGSATPGSASSHGASGPGPSGGGSAPAGGAPRGGSPPRPGSVPTGNGSSRTSRQSDDPSCGEGDPPRPRSAGKVAASGSGLGLAVCRSLIEAAGGDIDVISTPGQGATFILTIPFATRAAAATPATPAA